MKLKAALLAVTLAVAPIVYAADVEPPATPAGGAPEAGLAGGTIAGIGIAAVVVIAVASDSSDDDGRNTGTGTGTR